MLDLFPIQTKAGYDYYYQTHEFTEDQVKSNISSAFLDQETHGMRWQEQKAYFDYHVGQVFKPEITLITAGTEVSISLEAIPRFESFLSKFSKFLGRGIGVTPEKMLYFIPYFKSLVEYMESNGNEVSKIYSSVLPKLIERIRSGEISNKNEELIPYQKKLIKELLPIMVRIENSLK